MPSLNKVLLIGHLGRDPEVRYTKDGAAIANLSLATSISYKNKAGEKVEETEWHRVVFFGRLAEVAGEYMKKGSLMHVEGRLRTRKWQDKDGIDRYSTEIVGEGMQMLGGEGRRRDEVETDERPAKPARQEAAGADDDIPF